MDDKKNNSRIPENGKYYDDPDNGYDDDFSGEGPDLSDLDLSPSPKKRTSVPDFDDIDDLGGDFGKQASEPDRRSRRTRELNTAGTAVDPRTVKAESEKKKKSRVKKIICWCVLEVITLCCIFGYGVFLRYWNLINRPEVNESNVVNKNITAEKRQQMEEGYWTFAVFGVDGRNASDLVSKGLNSDVIMIVNVNKDTGEIRLVSVFRDTYLNISDDDTYRKINAAYANGGPEQALAALNKNLDLNITDYVTFNWKAVADGINILGGIDGIDLSKAELYYINAFITETVNVTGIGSHQLTSTGPQHLDGVQAVAYGRLRLMDNDFARTERQKRVIKAAFEKAKTAGFSVLNNIMVVCFPEVATNIDSNDLIVMAKNITKYHIGETGGFPWQRSASAISSVGDVVVPATLESNVRYLHQFLFDETDYEPSSAVLKYSATISEKTGIYKEGQVVESVRTDGGLISQPKTSAAEEEEEAEADSGEDDETEEEETVKATIGIDENGHYIYPTDEDGNNCIPTDSRGNVLYPTDPSGNIIWELDEDGNEIILYDENGEPVTAASGQTEEDGESGEEPGETSHADDINEADGPGAAGGTKKKTESHDSEGPGSATTAETTEAYGPGNPGGAAAGTESFSDQPGGSSGSTDGPGSSTETWGSAGPVIETTGAGSITPGGTDGPGSSGGPGSTGGPGT